MLLLFTSMVVSALSSDGWLSGSILETKSYRIEITETCTNAVGQCTASYLGTDKRTGASIRLHGTSEMVLCKDHITPCHFGRYKFPSGEYTYFVYPDGSLEVVRNGRLVVHEQGSWREAGA